MKWFLETYARLPTECEQLASIATVASRYNLSSLAELARNRLHERLDLLRRHSPPAEEVLEALISGLVVALCSHGDASVLQPYRDMISSMLVGPWRQPMGSSAAKPLILTHPGLDWDFAWFSAQEMEKQ
jgi:hypothetical protein